MSGLCSVVVVGGGYGCGRRWFLLSVVLVSTLFRTSSSAAAIQTRTTRAAASTQNNHHSPGLLLGSSCHHASASMVSYHHGGQQQNVLRMSAQQRPRCCLLSQDNTMTAVPRAVWCSRSIVTLSSCRGGGGDGIGNNNNNVGEKGVGFSGGGGGGAAGGLVRTSRESRHRTRKQQQHLPGGGGATVSSMTLDPTAAASSSSSSSNVGASGSSSSESFHLLSGIGKKVSVAVLTLTMTYLGYQYRSELSTLFDKKKLEAWLLTTLSEIDGYGNKGLALYSLAFAFWEMAGLPTVPVETVAGMTFGIQRAFLASGIGKLVGASLAYVLGRTLLNRLVRDKFNDNEILTLVDMSVQSKPMKTALLMKYSSFPELMKNFGLAILPPIRPWMFVLATALHGLPFTALWTHLGHDTTLRLRASEAGHILKANRLLQGLVLGVGAFGMLVGPTIVGYWIRDMRKQRQIREENSNK